MLGLGSLLLDTDALLVGSTILRLLLLVILSENLDFLAAVGTLQMVDALASNAELFVELLLLLFELLELHSTKARRVEFTEI